MELVNKLSKTIRVITIAPLMALVTLSILLWLRPEIYGGIPQYLLAVLFLTIFPVLGYPLQLVIPYFKKRGREGQRNLAILTAVAGYIGGIVSALFLRVQKSLLLIYLTYLISGIGIVIFNKLLHIRASGHACGVAGPVFILIYLIGPGALWGLIILALVYISSLQMKRHTLSQLIWGSAIPAVSMFIAGLITL